MKVEIFTISFNSMYVMPFFIEHYRERFPDAVINVFDDDSTDNTTSYCKSMGCNVVEIPQPDDCLSGAERTYGLKSKNHNRTVNHVNKINNLRSDYWKKSTADWVIVVDHDELVDMWEKDLKDIEEYDVVVFEGYNMYNETGNSDVELRSLKFGVDRDYDEESHLYDKPLMIRSNAKLKITGGGHSIVTEEGFALDNMQNQVRISDKEYRMYHYPKRLLSKENFLNYFRFYISLPEHEFIPQVEKLYSNFITNIKLVEVR
jgi:glycosyltransferase involved in cell wall biosynthesis